MEEFLKTHNIAGLQQMVDNNSQINKKDNDKNGKQDSFKAKGLSAHPTKSVAGLNQTPTIPDRKRTECPLPHAVGF